MQINMNNDDYIFALDIGTRTVIGVIMYYNGDNYEIIDSEFVEHEHRAMLDGQIHNVDAVAKEVQKVKESLENRLDIKLKKVAIAAAGRALKTVIKKYSMDFSIKKKITIDDVHALEFGAVQEAEKELLKSEQEHKGDYHFVGFSVKEYHLDDIFLTNLVGQMGRKISLEAIVTFLPRIVIDSLLSVIESVGLEVVHMTLEPIAASNLVIPREMYNFNLALIDIGAGTSDIAISNKGSMLGYAMVPVAGDEITEVLAESYLLDYYSAEKLKRKVMKEGEIKVHNALGNESRIEKDEILNIINPQVEKLADLITKSINEINQRTPQAVICIGGGSLTPNLIEILAGRLGMPGDRVGIKDSKDLKQISGRIEGINSTQSITSLGIGVTAHQSTEKTYFIDLIVNGSKVQLFSFVGAKLADALLAADIDSKKINARPGMGLTYTINGELKSIKGTMGKAGSVLLNGEKVDLDKSINTGDVIEFVEGVPGKDAHARIKDILPEEAKKSFNIIVNEETVKLSPRIYQNGKIVDINEELRDGADIVYKLIKTIRDAAAHLLEIKPSLLNNDVISFTFNGIIREIPVGDYIVKQDEKLLALDSELKDGMKLELIKSELGYEELTIDYLCKGKDFEDIRVILNNSELNIPLAGYRILANGEEVETNYSIKDGDDIVCEPQGMTVKRVLEYINYNLSPDKKQGVKILINDEESTLQSKVRDGDRLKINFT